MILLFLSFVLKLCTKFRCVITFWCILKVLKLFFNFDKNGFQGVWPTVKWYLLQLYFARKKVKKHYRKWVHFLSFALHKSNIALKENWNKSSIHLLHYFFTFAHYYTPWANIWKHPLQWLFKKCVLHKFYYKSTSFHCSKMIRPWLQR